MLVVQKLSHEDKVPGGNNRLQQKKIEELEKESTLKQKLKEASRFGHQWNI